MKYIDAEKLKAEVECRLEETRSMKPSFDQFWAGKINAFKDVIKIIGSLQQEQTDDTAVIENAFLDSLKKTLHSNMTESEKQIVVEQLLLFENILKTIRNGRRGK